jgi:hypothetical protein
MTFKDAASVTATINAGRDVERIRSANRALVDNLFNGEPPLSDAEAKEWGLQDNISWGEGAVLAAHARRQYTNNFLRNSRFFKLRIPTAPEEDRVTLEMKIGDAINRTMKRCFDYTLTVQEQFASVAAHGIGPQIWDDNESWLPKTVALEDFRVPTDTRVSFSNLEWFAIRDYYTEGQLAEKVFGEHSVEGWNKEAVAQILAQLHPINYQDSTYNWIQNPEKMAQVVKQNGGFYASDAVPTVALWRFYFKDMDPKTREVSWKLRVVVDTDSGNVAAPPSEFLYDSGDESEAESVDQILFVQFGDLNNKAPFLVASVRGMGFMLVEPCFWSNITICRMNQYLNESFNPWVQVTDPAGESRAQAIQLFNKGIFPPGVRIVPQNERHTVSGDLIDRVMGKMKQLQGEASSSYTQQNDNGTAREQTAYETSVRVSQVNAMASGIMLLVTIKAEFQYREICRRFCIRNSSDPDVQKFQKLMRSQGVDDKWLNVDLWEVEAETPLGAGNPAMEMSQARGLMELSVNMSPESQQKVLHKAVAAITNNPAEAQDLVPLGRQPVADNGLKWASSIFGTLMQGIMVPDNPEVSALQQAGPLIGMMSGVVSRLEQNGNLATASELIGLHTVEAYLRQLIGQISRNKDQSAIVQRLTQSLNQLSNILKGFDQRLAEQQKAQGSPEMQAIQIERASAIQDAQIKQASFQAEQQRKNAALQADQQRKNAALQAEQQRKDAASTAQIQRDSVETGASILLDEQATDAKIKQDAKAQAAKPEPASVT